MLMGLCEAKTADKAAENVDTVMRKTYYINSKNAVSKTAKIRTSALPQHQKFRGDDLSLFCKS